MEDGLVQSNEKYYQVTSRENLKTATLFDRSADFLVPRRFDVLDYSVYMTSLYYNQPNRTIDYTSPALWVFELCHLLFEYIFRRLDVL